MLEEQTLADALARFQLLAGYAGRTPDEPVEWETSYTVCEIMRSLRKIEKEYLPALISAVDRDRANDALHELREELRHVIYHINDSTYFSVVSS
jgi:hypothetical protein